MTLAAFGMILLLSRAGFEAENLEDFKGLNKRSKWFAFVMLGMAEYYLIKMGQVYF